MSPVFGALLACEAYRSGECYWGNLLRGMINHKSLFSSVRMDQCQIERVSEGEDVSSACHPAASLAANSPTPSPSYLLSSLSVSFFFSRNKWPQKKKILRAAEFLPPFSWVVVLNRPWQIRGTAFFFFFVCPHK